MKLTAKTDLTFIDGYLSDMYGNIINNPQLISEYNKYVEVCHFNEWLIANEDAIKASKATTMVYRPAKKESPIALPDHKTPPYDNQEKQPLAVWEELQTKDIVTKVNTLLNKSEALVEFITSDHILVADCSDIPNKFNGNVLELTKEELIDTYQTFTDLKELRDAVVIETN